MTKTLRRLRRSRNGKFISDPWWVKAFQWSIRNWKSILAATATAILGYCAHYF